MRILTYLLLTCIKNEEKSFHFRSLNELSHRIDESSKKCQKVENLFSPSLNGLRSKIRDIAGNFIKNRLYSSQHSGILDYAWRKGSYEIIQHARKLKINQTWNNLETAYMKSHLINCMGHYQHLLLDLESGLDFENHSSYGLIYEGILRKKIGNL